jgi:hypothetical protein
MSNLAEIVQNPQAIHADAIDLVQCFYDPLRSKGIASARRDSPQPSRDVVAVRTQHLAKLHKMIDAFRGPNKAIFRT